MKIKSGFALLDVKAGREVLFEHFVTDDGYAVQNPDKIPVVIYGEIVGAWGNDDGISQEFDVSVKSVNIDYTSQGLSTEEET